MKHAIDHAAHLLPAQGPITVFIHHNTLHAFEDLPFDEAVNRGGKVFGCQPYLTEDRYREELEAGASASATFRRFCQEDLGPAGRSKRARPTRLLELRLAMLELSHCATGRPRNCCGSWRKQTLCGASGRTSPRPASLLIAETRTG